MPAGRAWGQNFNWSNGHISPQDCLREAAGCKAEVWRGAGLVRLVGVPGRSETLPAELIRHRGRVAGQSRKARARQMSKLAKVRTVGVPLPFFAARTFPDRVPDAGLVPGMDDRFFKRLLRRFPDAGVFWRRELQERKSGKASLGELVPHFHDLIWGVPRQGETGAAITDAVIFVRILPM
jgi:hypothetical protein